MVYLAGSLTHYLYTYEKSQTRHSPTYIRGKLVILDVALLPYPDTYVFCFLDVYCRQPIIVQYITD